MSTLGKVLLDAQATFSDQQQVSRMEPVTPGAARLLCGHPLGCGIEKSCPFVRSFPSALDVRRRYVVCPCDHSSAFDENFFCPAPCSTRILYASRSCTRPRVIASRFLHHSIRQSSKPAKMTKKKTQAQKDAIHASVLDYFKNAYGTNCERLAAWQSLCKDVGVEKGESITQCKKVRLVDYCRVLSICEKVYLTWLTESQGLLHQHCAVRASQDDYVPRPAGCASLPLGTRARKLHSWWQCLPAEEG